MAKPGLDGSTVRPLLSEAAQGSGWSLCVGAGVSTPVFPDWGQMADALMRRVLGPSGLSRKSAPLDGYSIDALIEATRHRLGCEPDAFCEVLSEELYSDLRRRLSTEEWRCLSKVFAAKAPGDCGDDIWKTFASVRSAHFDTTSAAALARVLAPLIGSASAPRDVLCFNVEPLLYALLTHETHLLAMGSGAQRLDLVTRATSSRRAERLPFVYCHGLLPVPSTTPRRARVSPEKLIFSEAQYLNLSSQTYSWQASTFVDAAAQRRILFLGVSLSDSNMRRWLSWVHQNRVSEVNLLAEASPAPASVGGAGTPDLTMHLWINERPDEALVPWIEASVAHLGVRLVWINNWSEVGGVLRRLLA